jgi:hypothetical protein
MELQAYLHPLRHSYTSNDTQILMIDTNEFTKPSVVYRDFVTVTWRCDTSWRDGPSCHDTIGPA